MLLLYYEQSLFYGILLSSFGTFDKAIDIFDGHSHNMFIFQQYCAIDLYIALYLNYEKNFKKFKVKMMTPYCVTSSLLMTPVM